MSRYRCAKHPMPTVDIIIRSRGGVVLVKRKFPPYGWALPGGFVEKGETVEAAARREALEETGLRVRLVRLQGVYSDPRRDPRQHTIATVFTARPRDGRSVPRGGDDAAEARVFLTGQLPARLAFDHAKILKDYYYYCENTPRTRAQARVL